jgi:tetratricopeptide (TPR) repeat protein
LPKLHAKLMLMKVKLSNLEKQLFSSPKTDLARGTLVASGIRTKKELDRYLSRMDKLCQQLEVAVTVKDEIEKARGIFAWLWQTKPNRSERQGSFKLTEVINAQLDPDAEKVGNCLGLTVLYNVLAQRFGLKSKAIHVEDALGQGPHVFSILETAQGIIDVENILPNGFDFKGHLRNPQRTIWGNAELIADIYHSTGNKFFEQGNHEEAVQSYSKAILLNPKYTKAHLNRALALFLLGRDEEATKDLER